MSPDLCHVFVAVAVTLVAGAAADASSIHRRDEVEVAVLEPKSGLRGLPGAAPHSSRLLHKDPSLRFGSHAGDPVSNSCEDLDLSVFLKGQLCGAPLSSPCFDIDR